MWKCCCAGVLLLLHLVVVLTGCPESLHQVVD